MTPEDRGDYEYTMQTVEKIEAREIPDFPKKEITSEKEELKLHLAELEASLKDERSDAKIGIAGAKKRIKRLEILIESLNKKIAAINE